MLQIALAVAVSMAGAGPDGPPAVADIPTIRLAELVEAGPMGLVLSGTARAHAGKRVRLVGFMARTEEPEQGAFWLAPRPVVCDEGGAGTGDLPPESVRVIVRSRPAEGTTQVEGPIAVTGTLEVGRLADARSHVSWLRLLLDEPVHAGAPSEAKPQQPSQARP
jgi:hypothetical protein